MRTGKPKGKRSLRTSAADGRKDRCQKPKPAPKRPPHEQKLTVAHSFNVKIVRKNARNEDHPQGIFFFFFKEQDGGKRRIFNWLRIFSRRTRFPESGAALVLVCWSSPREFSGLHSRRAISVPSDQITDMPSLAPRWSGSAGICTHTHQGTGTCCGVT